MRLDKKDRIIGVLLLLVGLLLIVDFKGTGHNTNASTEHTYHANMIGKTFEMESIDTNSKGMHHRADKFVDHVRNIQDYTVHTSYTNHGVEKEHVDLVRKHESPYQRKMLSLQRKITNSTQAPH